MAEMLWELKNLGTDEVFEGPVPLPENWGPIFGLAAIKSKLGNLDWLENDKYANCGWVETQTPVPTLAEPPTLVQIEWDRAKLLLSESDWSMLSDVPMTVGEKQLWIDYRSELRNIRSQAGFPDNIEWPEKPE